MYMCVCAHVCVIVVCLIVVCVYVCLTVVCVYVCVRACACMCAGINIFLPTLYVHGTKHPGVCFCPLQKTQLLVFVTSTCATGSYRKRKPNCWQCYTFCSNLHKPSTTDCITRKQYSRSKKNARPDNELEEIFEGPHRLP